MIYLKTIHKSSLVIVTLIALIALPLGLKLLTKPTRIKISAETVTANFFFAPSSATMSADTTFKIRLDPKTAKVVFVKVKGTFNPAKIQLKSDITSISGILSRVVKNTSAAAASSSGAFELVLAAPPGPATASGIIDLASITLKAVSTVPNDSARIDFDTSHMQAVNEVAGNLLISSSPLLLTLNPSSATPAVTPVNSTLTLYPTDDTFVASDNPTGSYYASNHLQVDHSPDYISYIKFDLSSLAGKTITGAKLKFYVTNPSFGTQNIRYTQTSDWLESLINYNNRPLLGSLITTFIKNSSGDFEVDFTDAVRSLTGQVLSLGFDSTSTDGLDFFSKEYTTAAYRPQLVINYY